MLIKRYKLGAAVPWYLGRVCYDIEMNMVVVAPIPLNLVIRGMLGLWQRTRRGWKDKVNERIANSYQQGYRDGWQDCTRYVEEKATNITYKIGTNFPESLDYDIEEKTKR